MSVKYLAERTKIAAVMALAFVTFTLGMAVGMTMAAPVPLLARQETVATAQTVEVEVRSEHPVIVAAVRRLEAERTGGYVELVLSLRYSRGTGGPASMTVSSLAVRHLNPVAIDPKLPVEVQDGGEVTIRLLLKKPDGWSGGPVKVIIYT